MPILLQKNCEEVKFYTNFILFEFDLSQLMGIFISKF